MIQQESRSILNDSEDTMPEIEPLMKDREVSKATGVSVHTLKAWRVSERRKSFRNMPLPFIRLGRTILYRPADVRAFLAEKTITPGEGKRRKRRAA
jgi:hypothetical protein